MLALAELGIGADPSESKRRSSPRRRPNAVRQRPDGGRIASGPDRRAVGARHGQPRQGGGAGGHPADELGGLVELVARPEGVAAVEETGETLEENARLKASRARRGDG